MNILVTGATGYVGSQLVPLLLQAGHKVRCIVRDPASGKAKSLIGATLVQGDALDAHTLPPALQGIEVAYYLIHSMGGEQAGFEQRDQLAARNFATAAKQWGVRRIIFLGGLASPGEISDHLKSRHETGAILREFGPPVTEFRAGIIVGNGSVSFEMIRYLTERLPVMICPRWVITRTQPIAIANVLEYLAAALEVPESANQIIEVGGATVETYRSMMLTYARARGLRRWLLRVPVLTPKLSSYWLRIVTPIPSAIARPLIEGLRTEVVCTSKLVGELFPRIRPVSYAAAVETAMSRTVPNPSFQNSVKKDAAHTAIRCEGLICDIRQISVNAPATRVFSILECLGAEQGWLYANFLWQIRGTMDRLIGGVGMKRGRSCKTQLRPGDHLDFWRIEEVTPAQSLILKAEMKLPGRAWLQFGLSPAASDKTLIRCIAWFEPRGLAGELYWWVLYPIHVLIFRGLVRAIQKKSEGKLRPALEKAPRSLPPTIQYDLSSMFSQRSNWRLTQNRFTEEQHKLRKQGSALLDLTLSNPTRAEISYNSNDILQSLCNGTAMDYDPQPKGLLSAREAVVEYYRSNHRTSVDPESVVLTTSTSEGYSYVLRLLCNPGDEILAPKPSYPLFEFLADLNDVKLVPYSLIYDYGWQIDFHYLDEAVSERSRAVVVVNPNNPTGSFVSQVERQHLNQFCRRNKLCLLVDEVFLDYSHDPLARDTFVSNAETLTFTLSGISKISGLPQMKLAWAALSGPTDQVAEAMNRLEIIADTYLSMNAPIQSAAQVLLEQREEVQPQLLERVRANLLELDCQLAGQKSCERLTVQGGWYAILRVPVTGSDEDLAIELLHKTGVVVHPGHFYDFPTDGYLVLSLITPLADFREGIRRVIAHLTF